MAEEMGYQQKLYYGNAGSAATIQVTNATDADYDLSHDKGSTTARGTGGDPPVKTENVVMRNVTITWSMLNDPSDGQLTDLLAFAKVGGACALKLDTNSGATLIDGDFTIAKKLNAPLNGEATYDFTATPTKSAGRSPTIG